MTVLPDFKTLEPLDLPVERHCFGCSPTNPVGLKLKFYRAQSALYTQFTPKKDHVGWGNITHGGIMATLLDEISAWTTMSLMQTFCVTETLNLTYHKPVPVDVTVTVKGQVLRQDHKRTYIIASILDAQGQVCVQADVQMRQMRHRQAVRLNIMSPQEADAMQAFFDKQAQRG